MQPLAGIRVLDLSKVLAGPLCGQYLGELGADVTKVEPLDGGDDTRGWFPQKSGQSASFLAVNHDKRSLAIDLKSAAGRAVLHRLAERADVVLQGFGGGTAARLGVDYETLRALNPRLIYCEISGYGRSGPLGNAPGYDVMLQAFSGMLSTMGEPGGGHARASFSPIDQGTGMHALSGILAALIERGRTGEGVYLEVSLLDTAMGFMGYLAQTYWCSGRTPVPMGTGHPAMAPYQAFMAADGAVLIGVANEAQWKRFCPAVGLEDMQADPDFATNEVRVRHFARTAERVQRRIGTQPVAHWIERLHAANVPCAPIHTLDQALAHPQVESRELFVASAHPVLGEIRNLRWPVRFDGRSRTAARPPPLLGEHSAELLREAGFSEAEVAGLLAEGTVAGPRSRSATAPPSTSAPPPADLSTPANRTP